jgi:hypothetical protein
VKVSENEKWAINKSETDFNKIETDFNQTGGMIGN